GVRPRLALLFCAYGDSTASSSASSCSRIVIAMVPESIAARSFALGLGLALYLALVLGEFCLELDPFAPALVLLRGLALAGRAGGVTGSTRGPLGRHPVVAMPPLAL